MRVKLQVDEFDKAAIGLLNKRPIGWREYSDFMRRCGWHPYRGDKYGFARVCIVPYDGAPLLEDCLGLTVKTRNSEDISTLYYTHARRVIHWVIQSNLAQNTFIVSDRFMKRNIRLRGFFTKHSS